MNPYCVKKDRTVYDKTCRTMVNFDCKAEGGNYSGYGASAGGYGESSYEPEYKCQRSHETKCYTTPRTVSSDYCEDREEKVCEKLTEMVPVPVERQNCHDENKKVCELEERSQPKQVKKYVYTKECRPVSKTVCDNAEQKQLQVSCVPSSRKECSYQPKERCETFQSSIVTKSPTKSKRWNVQAMKAIALMVMEVLAMMGMEVLAMMSTNR